MSQKWTREKAIQYLAENTPGSDLDNRKAIERYIVMPGQATAYKVGMLKILELRKKSKAVLGKKFDIRDFHQVILGQGPLPLSLLGKEVEAWMIENGLIEPSTDEVSVPINKPCQGH